jgi:MFS family permease
MLVILTLWRWQRVPPQTALPPEKFTSAILTGLRYTRNSPALLATIYRSVGFYFFASVMWAMLPLIARDLLQGDASTYSYLFAAISIGAIISALVIPYLRRRYDNDQLITYSSRLFAVGMSITALVHVHIVAMLSLFLCGAAWITVMTSAQMSAQTALPNWVKSRGIAVFLTFFMGSLGIGPVVWGSITDWTNLPTAMLVASIGLLISSQITQRWPVSGNDQLDHTPSQHWRKPELKVEIMPDQGPVLVEVRYQVAPEHLKEFMREIELLGLGRKRDGAVFWGVFEDMSTPGTYVESYAVKTWLDRLRQHERISRQDAQTQTRIRALLVDGTEPLVQHFVTPAHD